MAQIQSFCTRRFFKNTQIQRKIVQYLFLVITLLIGLQFSIFVAQLEKGMPPAVSRPAGVEAFLPISSLISLKFWLVSGVFNEIHPSGLVIMLIVLCTALFLKRGFCSWVCPFGLLTEYLNRLHRLIFKRDLRIPFWIDYPLRSLKYLLLCFFLWAIVINMDAVALEYFIYSPYNMVADIKMLYFFSNISHFAFWTLVILMTLSVLLRNFWCRYLCPYGALLGVLSFSSLFKIHRNEETCTDCRKCTLVCPVDIEVHKKRVVVSDECHACLRCMGVCLEKDTVFFSMFGMKKGVLKPWMLTLAMLLLFTGGPRIATMTGHWETSISTNEYLFHVTHIDLPFYRHTRGRVSNYPMEEWLYMMKRLRQTDRSVLPH